MVHVPESVEEFRPPKAADLITEAANFLRSPHWSEVRPHFRRMSGEDESTHGSFAFEQAACAFKIQDIARQNGFAILATVPTDKMWRAIRYAYKRNTGDALHLFENQYRLRLQDHRS